MPSKNFRKKIISFFFVILLVANFGLAKNSAGKEYIVKYATLAPEGTTWMNFMREFDKEVRAKSNNRLKFKIYPGGISGDEKDVIRKIRIGQRHSGGFTGVGMGMILPEVRALDLPFLFNNQEEVDYIYSAFFDYFFDAFNKKGYTLLGWAEVGPVHIFSNKPIATIKDMAGVKMWKWEGDPMAEEMLKALGISPYSLSIADVLMSLQRGLIDAVYGSPYAAISMQWFTRIKYISMYPIANASGSVLISNRFFNKLPQDLQKILLDVSKKKFPRLISLTRKANDDSIKAMEKAGIVLIDKPEDKDLKPFLKAGETVRNNLVNKLYSKELLEKINSSLHSFRTKQAVVGD